LYIPLHYIEAIGTYMAFTTRWEHRYIDSISGSTLDVWSPSNNTKRARRCLAQKYGVIRSDHIEVALTSLDSANSILRLSIEKPCYNSYERGITLNLCAKTANPCAGVLRDTVMSERGPTVVHCYWFS